MSANTTIDYRALAWVKKELDETLLHARQALESYVEAPDDPAPLQLCADLLHQILGTLQIMELSGAALLAEEMELLTKSLLQDVVKQKNDAYEVLMRAILQLPDYLEKLQAGQKDQPIFLLPLLNELRAARGDKLFSELLLFTPDIAGIAPLGKPGAGTPAADNKDIRWEARRLRHRYQVALLGWYKGQNPGANLKALGDVIARLEALSTQQPVVQLWWVAGALLEALGQGGLDATISVKLVLGQLDRQIKRLIDEDEAGLAAAPPAPLIKNMLYYVAQAQACGERAAAVKTAFRLDEVLPNASEVARVRESLSSPNLALLQSVAAVIKEDLARVKEALDIYMRAERDQPADLAPLADILRQVMYTLRMLGLESARTLAQKNAALIADFVSGAVEPTESRMFDIARAMLMIESSLDDMILSSGGAPDWEAGHAPADESGDGASADSAAARLSELEFQQITSATLHEAAATLAAIKEAILTFIKAPDDYTVLEPAPRLFHEILGSLRMLSLDRVAELLESVRRYTEHELVERRVVPTQEHLDRLADAITSVDWYIELTAEQGGGWESILDKAETSVALLGYPVGQGGSAAVEDVVKPQPEQAVEPAAQESAAVPDLIYDESAAEAAEPAPPAWLEESVEFVTEEPAAADQQEALSALPDLSADEAVADKGLDQAQPAQPGAAGGELAVEEPAVLPDVEQPEAPIEVLDLSPDEALVAAGADQALPAWSEESIELVAGDAGVGEVVEPAQQVSLEELIEPVAEQAAASDVADQALAAQLYEAVEPVPEEPAAPFAADQLEAPGTLLDLAPDEHEVVTPLEDEAEPESIELVDVEAAATEEPGETSPQSQADAPVSPGAAAGVASEPLPEDLDPEILGIFIEEAEEELSVIQELLPRWQADADDQDALTRIRRSFHTLKGSGRLVGARLVGEFAWAFENMLNRVIDGSVAAGPAHFDLLQQAVAILPALIDQLKGGPAPSIDVQQLMARAQTFAQPDMAAEPTVAEAEPTPASADGAALLMDPVLYEIYSKEAFGHLEQIERFVDLCMNGGGDCQVTDGLIRALHTLHGSSRMAGVMSTAEIAATLEKYAKAHRETGTPVTMDGCIALTDSITFIRAMLALLNVPDTSLPDHTALLLRLSELVRQPMAHAGQSEEHRDETASAEGEDTLAQELPEVPVEARPEEPVSEPSEEQAAALEMLPPPAPSAASREEPSRPAVHPGVDEPDLELLDIFLDEGVEIIESSEVDLQRWVQNQDNPALVAGLQRALHTLKGGARMVGLVAIADLSHALETLLTGVVDGYVTISKPLFDVLQRSVDRLSRMLELAREQAPVEPAGDLIAELSRVQSSATAVIVDAPAQPEELPQAVESAEPAPQGAAAPEEVALEATPAAGGPEYAEEAEEAVSPHQERRHLSRMQHEMVRVRADILDNLVNYAGEVSIYRSRLEQQVGGLRFNLAELDQTVARLRDQLRRLELETEAQILARHERDTGWHREDFDPLELDQYSQLQQLSRALGESVSDLSSIQGLLDNTTREAATLLLQQARVNTDLQEGLMRTRMVPFSGLAGRLRRIVRQSCHELGKRAELQLIGTESELDRTVLDRIVAPLEHMLRNAVSHGIEMPASRAAAGKPDSGTITVALSRDGAEVVIQVSDDGAGLNLAAIRRRAVERGLLREDAEISDQDLSRFILEAGFSTAETVTQISGRGVGMDVVNSEIKQLGGALEIHTQPGRGSRFTIRLPFTLAISQALLVQANQEIFAVPLTSVAGIVRLTHEELERHYADDALLYQYAGQDYQVRHLGSLLNIGASHLPGPGRKLPALLVRTGEYRAALVVEGLQGSREIVVKPMGSQLSGVRGVSGATILGDGRVVLILDLAALVRLDAAMPITVENIRPVAAPSPASDVTVMVVDDSITVRKVTARLLERHDMKVITAKDGVDALAVLQEHRPDVMLLDIEMPRMDGYELATHIRNDERLRDLPIVMITSRTGEKHRRRAMEIGVDRYLGKPYQETELLDTIREVVANARAVEVEI